MVEARWWRQRQKRRWGVPVLLVVYVGYVGLGAGVLQALERPAEARAAQHLLRQRWELLANHTCLRGPALQRLIEGIVQAYKSGITLQGNTTSLGRWDFSGSFFFSISAITTIGYGNLSPSTAAGRIFCILFALFGIPLNLVLLNEIGQLMLLGVQHCSHRLEEAFHLQKKSSLLIKTSALVTGLLLFLLLPPLLLSDKEGWSYEEGFYYSFITLSTIGFGDYVIESSSDFCQCNKSTVEKFMDGNRNSTKGLHDVEICNDKDTKTKGPDEPHTYTAPAEAL
ncbi:potassium channel subfamily K member 17 isoform X2 [Pezoporus occidentalis]|uniref:potassium channel subfamily K member 17 isoform X2 n=1 Tax=Pezoporus occidentalis TaxID=407982 RepID=UPI002F9145C9